jgi:thiosulfate reductase/polysulfide reductase chain A
LIRDKSRGSDSFRVATWEEALDLVAENMLKIKDEYGAEALALFQHGYGSSWFKHLFKAYGSPNVAAPSFAQCRGPREVGFQMTYGELVGSPERVDMEHSDCIVLIGSHLGENMHNTQVQDFTRAVARNADIIVVDPRFSTAAGKADHWLPIKPGTDIALLLAWMHVIINENLYDTAYVDGYTFGLDQLRSHVADKTPEWAYVRTGIKPDVIRKTARVMAAAKPAVVVHPGRRVTWYGDDTQRSRAIAILTALLGSWGRRGGYLLPQAMSIPAYDYKPYEKEAASAIADKPDATDYPLAYSALASGICDASIPGSSIYDVKGWFVYGTNLPTTLPKPENTYKALQNLDFVVACDVLPAEITGWADVVLPESTYLERCDEIHIPAYKEPFAAIRQPVVEPMFESKPGWWIAKEIGKRIGLADYFPYADGEEYVTARLKKGGFDCEEIRKTGVVKGEVKPVTIEDGAVPEFFTNTGKIELYSTELANYGFDPLPEFSAPVEPPRGYYRLLVGRSPVHTFGRTANNRVLCEVEDTNTVWMHTSVAKSFGLNNGDMILLVNQDGVEEGPIAATVTERIRTDCVYMVHGFGHKSKKLSLAYKRGADDAALMTKIKTDPVMGGTGVNVNFVTFRRADA